MVVVALAALFGTAGCGQNAAEAPAQGGQALPVKLMTAKTQTVSESTRYVATLESRRSVNLQPRIDGQVTKLLVRAGDAVPAGAPLVQIDPKEQQAGVAGSTAAVAASRAALNSSEQQLRSSQAERTSRLATLRLQQQQYNRYTALLKEGAVSAQTVDEYRASLDSARASVAAIDAQLRSQAAQVKQARDALNQSQASLRQQQVQLDYYQIAAPFAGTVGYIPVKVGDYASTSTRLLTLTQNQPLDVNVAIPMEQASRLRKGTPVELLDERGTVVGESRVFFVAPNVDTGNQTVLVKALFPNTQNRLKADQLLQARVIWRRRAGLLVPASAVARVAGQDFVFVAQPNPKGGGLVAKQRPVTLGEIQGNDYQVASGVKPQEKVIVTGLLKLSDGVPIVPES
jgi:multidrug efflux pump subunit AcrA (membrane-fusion protein)